MIEKLEIEAFECPNSYKKSQSQNVKKSISLKCRQWFQIQRNLKKQQKLKCIKWRSQRNTKTLEFATPDRTSFPFVFNYFMYANMSKRSLKKFQLSLPYNSEFGDKEFIILAKILSKLTLLQQFELNFQYNDESTDETLFAISTALLGLKKIQSLSINFGDNRMFTDAGLQRFSKTLKNMPEIKNLNINFSLNSQFTDEGLIALGLEVQSLRQLQSFNLDIYYNENFSDKFLNTLAITLKNSSNLHCLHLAFFNTLQCTEQGIVNLLEACSTLENLKDYSLKLKLHEEFDEIQYSKCFTSLSKQNKLTNLDLQIFCGQAFNNSNSLLTQLGDSVSKFKELKQCTLCFPWIQQQEEKAMIELFMSLSNLTHLEELKLNFGQNFNDKTSDYYLEKIQDRFAQLIKLKSFSIDFQFNGQFTDTGLQHFANGVFQLKNLESLSLSLQQSKKITKEGLKFLYDKISQLPQLKNIKIATTLRYQFNLQAFKNYIYDN